MQPLIPRTNAKKPNGAPRPRQKKRASTLEEMEFQAQQLLEVLVRAMIARRLSLGISQRELAVRSGLAQAFVCDIEKARRNPTWKTLVALCRALETTLPELVLDSLFRDVKLSHAQRKIVTKLSSMLAGFPQTRRTTGDQQHMVK